MDGWCSYRLIVTAFAVILWYCMHVHATTELKSSYPVSTIAIYAPPVGQCVFLLLSLSLFFFFFIYYLWFSVWTRKAETQKHNYWRFLSTCFSTSALLVYVQAGRRLTQYCVSIPSR
uniref:Uncharacterized protein n=1 Tax=Trypanosoma vivax (strain Y486) TaxID=1055687 RepID=G0UA85_TRYVY|nr:hypothetical protein TVY486_1102020 [Trypanosoma vivax Y486]